MDAERFRPLLDDDDFPSSPWDRASAESSSDDVDGTNATTEGGRSTVGNGENDLPTIVMLMRVGNVAVAAVLMFGSAGNILNVLSLPKMVLAGYGICFGLLICSLESNLSFLRKPIASNFGFLYNPILRFMFYVLMGMVAWSFGTVLGKISAGLLSFQAVVNTYVLCRYKGYGKALREVSDEEEAKLMREGVRHLLDQGASLPWWEV
ncbi:hypothetical protein ACHAXA_009931 [Cyclostephanos tholiformis]|uniref:Uncharacterized protein n=1 Tax=Cyclostephanos tholiformis TaxID=382380 RepID=A0ABD3RXZ7_9STRA